MHRNDPPGSLRPAGPARFLLASMAIVASDQAAKAAVRIWLEARGTVEILPGWFDMTLVRNTGALFGLGRSFDPWLRTIAFTLVPATAAILLAVLLVRGRRRDRLYLAGLASILGGALGNLIDRVRLGYVVDFLDLHWRGFHWPAFNLADACICIGVGLLGLDLLRDRQSGRNDVPGTL